MLLRIFLLYLKLVKEVGLVLRNLGGLIIGKVRNYVRVFRDWLRNGGMGVVLIIGRFIGYEGRNSGLDFMVFITNCDFIFFINHHHYSLSSLPSKKNNNKLNLKKTQTPIPIWLTIS